MKFIVLSGAIKNAGDFLIVQRSLNLLKGVYPDADMQVLERSKNLAPHLQAINAADAVILAGGPCIQADIYPSGIPLVDNLDDIKVPIFTIGMGWYGRSDASDDVYHRFALTPRTHVLFSRLAQDYDISCRDWESMHILRQYGIPNVIMTGCPAWYAPAMDTAYLPRVTSKVQSSTGGGH